jgi:hypothetical protein
VFSVIVYYKTLCGLVLQKGEGLVRDHVMRMRDPSPAPAPSVAASDTPRCLAVMFSTWLALFADGAFVQFSWDSRGECLDDSTTPGIV